MTAQMIRSVESLLSERGRDSDCGDATGAVSAGAEDDYGRQWERVCVARSDHRLAGVSGVLCSSIPLVGERIKRKHERFVARVLAEEQRLEYDHQQKVQARSSSAKC